MKKHLFHKRTSITERATSSVLIIIFAYYSGNSGQLIEEMGVFLTIFLGSLGFYFILYPWIRIDEICVSDSCIEVKERVGFGIKVRKLVIKNDEVDDFKMVKDSLKLKCKSETISLSLNNYNLVKIIEGSNSFKVNERWSDVQVFELISSKLKLTC